jgi:hypothetical protein
MSVSAPFFTLSEQLATLHAPLWHTPLAQFAAAPQAFPSPHFVAQVPPQSTSDSAPFFTASEHVGTWHVPPTHTLLWHSEATEQYRPSLQARQSPPQSMSVSLPLRWPSLQVDC